MRHLTPSDRLRLAEIFDEALDLPADQRAAYLDVSCPGPSPLRQTLDRMLAASDHTAGFLDQPLGSLMPELLQSVAEELDGPEFPKAGPYRIVEELGRGGMGVVYLAERADGAFEQRVALKLIKRGMDSDAILDRFLNERQILARLEHPNIARLLDGGVTEDGRPYFAMERVEGLPITAYCEQHSLAVRDRLELFRLACIAVECAHANLVIHRDLKPRNILVTPDGRLKLLDFGIAKLLADDDFGDEALTRTVARHALLTPDFAAPEQLSGQPVTTATDVYALGVVLYEMLTGERPFRMRSLTSESMIQTVETTLPKPPSAAVGRSARAGSNVVSLRPDRLRRQLAGDLDTIVLKAIHREPDRRYPSAEALRLDIDRHLAGLPVLARPDSVRYRLTKFVGRHKAGVAASGFMALSLMVGLGATVWQAHQARLERDAARQAAERADQVSSLLVGLFDLADPAQAQGDELTAREALDRAAARLPSELADQPLIQAEMADAIGRAYFGLGRYEQAGTLLESALRLRRQELGPRHLDVAGALIHLGLLRRNQSDYIAADSMYREALSIRRAQLRADDPLIVESLNGLGFVLRGYGDFDEAELIYREALDQGRRTLDGPHLELANSLSGLAATMQSTGDYSGAETLFREALAMNRTLHGPEHPRVEINVYNLAVAVHEQGDLAEAEDLYREAVRVGAHVLGEDHPLYAVDLQGLASLLAQKGLVQEAEGLYREALEIQRNTLDNSHARIATTLVGLGGLLASTGRAPEAEPSLRQALGIRREKLRATSWQVAEAEAALGNCLSLMGVFGEAEPLLVNALDMLVRVRGEDDRHTTVARQALARHRERLAAGARL